MSKKPQSFNEEVVNYFKHDFVAICALSIFGLGTTGLRSCWLPFY